MEEILASIRRIISDDEAKPAAASATAAPAPAAPPKMEAPKAAAPKTEVPKAELARPAPALRPAMAGIPPSKIAPPRPAPAPASPPAAKNSQAEIDAMMASFDAPAAAPPPAEPEIDADADVFELTEQMAVPELPPPTFNTIEPEDDLEFTETPMVQTAHHRSPAMDPLSFAERAPAQREMPVPQILSGSTVSAVESAFNSLAATVLSNNARTLEDLVKEMLRPMLKSWLDDNLPNLVERIVKAEIERVSRGR